MILSLPWFCSPYVISPGKIFPLSNLNKELLYIAWGSSPLLVTHAHMNLLNLPLEALTYHLPGPALPAPRGVTCEAFLARGITFSACRSEGWSMENVVLCSRSKSHWTESPCHLKNDTKEANPNQEDSTYSKGIQSLPRLSLVSERAIASNALGDSNRHDRQVYSHVMLQQTHPRNIEWSKLDDGWPESVEEQGLLLLVWRHHTTKQYMKDVL